MPDSAIKMERRSILEPALAELERAPSDPGVYLSEKTFTGRMVLRALEDTAVLNEALQSILGAELPETPNTTAHGKNTTVFWLREGQWLVVTDPGHYEDIKAKIDKALSDKDSSLVDISDGYTALELSGDYARDVLKKGCPLDIHPRVFPAGSMAQTRIVHADILLHYTQDDAKGAPYYDIYVRTSFAEYLLRWLTDAGLEFNIEVTKS